MTGHETITLEYPRVPGQVYEDIEIDKGIAPLIQACWDIGLRTLNSCEENSPGVAWISFEHYSAEEFLTTVAQFDPEDLELWDYQAVIYTEYARTKDGKELLTSPPNYRIRISVRFPNEWIPELTRQLYRRKFVVMG